MEYNNNNNSLAWILESSLSSLLCGLYSIPIKWDLRKVPGVFANATARVVYVNTDKTQNCSGELIQWTGTTRMMMVGRGEGGTRTSGAITTTGSLMWEIVRGNKFKSFLFVFHSVRLGNPIDCNLGLFNCISKNHPDPIKAPPVLIIPC